VSALVARVPLRRNRPFAVFCASQTVSAIGDGVSLVALPLLVLDATGSVAKMGLVTAAGTVGYIVAGAFGGVVVDRFDRRRLMVVTSVLQAVAYLAVPVAWAVSPQVWLLFVVMPAGAVLGTTFQVGYVAVLPTLVAGDQLTSANGALQSGLAAGGIGGSAVAGVLCAVLGPATAVGVDAGTFVVAALGVLAIRLPGPARPADSAGPLRWPDYLAGLRFLWATPVLRALTVLLSVQTFITLGVTDLMIFHLRHDLRQPAPVVGYVLMAASVGTLAAGMCVGRLRRRFGFPACWIGSGVLAGVAVAMLGYTRSAVPAAVLAAGFLGSITIGGTCSMSLRQEITPPHLLGRVTAAFWTSHYLLGPLGAALLTAAAGRYSVATVCLAAGVVLAGSALAGLGTAIATPRWWRGVWCRTRRAPAR
jgi:MFS family permease